MNILSVTSGPAFLNEKCLWNVGGYYVGLETGKKYITTTHRHCPQLQAIIRAVDTDNQTGMLHLNPGTPQDADPQENRTDWKTRYVGCRVTVEEAHFYGDKKVFRCLELKEYFSEDELEILDPPALSPYR